MATSHSDDGREQRFYKGDVIVVRDNEYTVTQADITIDGDVLQYRLDAEREDLAGSIRVNDDGSYVICEYHSVDGDDITVIE